MNVTFQIEGGAPVQIGCTAGDNLLELARRANVAIDAPCSGNGSCGKCRVKLLEGQAESLPSRHISGEDYASGWRLACCTQVTGDCTVWVPDIASAYRSRMKTADLSRPQEAAIFRKAQQDLQSRGIPFQNSFLALDLQLDPPSQENTMPDSERLTRAIEGMLPGVQAEIPFSLMRELAASLRAHEFRVCVKGQHLGDRFRCMEICGSGDTLLAACALDIGTTTVSALLTDLKDGRILAKGSCGNGQIRYGADVINRIIQQSRPGGREKLQDAIIGETLVPLMDSLCRSAGISPRSVLRLSLGANTTMNHLLLGADADPIRTDPYIPSFFHWEGLLAGDLKLPANPAAPVVIAPNIGSYVGGDITAGTLASGIWDREEMSLFIDLGTNGEIVFGNRDFLISCACSAGPAFEGGDISCGMRATDGAVEAVTLDPVTLEPVLTVVGGPGQKCVGLCGSGIIDIIAELYRRGVIDPRGQFIREGRRIRRDSHGMGRYVLAFRDESETGREVAITEVDIDNFIRAKGAIYSAIDTMLQSVDLTADCIDRVYVAGGIGSGINMANAVCIGMLPDVEPEKYSYIGNASLAGAYALAVSDAAAEKCAEVAANMTYLELSTYPGYMDAFVAACFIPHTDAGRFPRSTQE